MRRVRSENKKGGNQNEEGQDLKRRRVGSEIKKGRMGKREEGGKWKWRWIAYQMKKWEFRAETRG